MMFIPKKSKYTHLPSYAYKGRKNLQYYVMSIKGKSAPYLLLEILNTSTFSDDEIISFCEKCKKKHISIIYIQNALYSSANSANSGFVYHSTVDKFITIVISKWNIK